MGEIYDPEKRVNLIFFDIDGTLLISQGAGGRSIIRTLRDVFGVTEEIAKIEIHGQTDRGIATQLFLAHNIDDNEENWLKFTAGYLDILDEELEQSGGSLLPGIPELLQSLEPRSDVELALLTGNIARGAQKKVNYFGIGEYFSWGGFGDNHRDRSDMARSAMETARLKVDVDEVNSVFVIGDTPNDIRCGKAIDAVTVAVATAGYTFDELAKCEPDYVLHDLSDLEQVTSILC